jgi:hypothetical protein
MYSYILFVLPQSKFFPTVKSKKLDVQKPLDHDVMNCIVEQIVERCGIMKVKLVIGQKLFKRKAAEIKKMVDMSTHAK